MSSSGSTTDQGPTTPAEIRSLYIETAEAALKADHRANTFGCGPGCTELEDIEATARIVADALEAAGLLPTWFQQMPGKGRYRYVTEWRNPEVAE